MRHIELEEHLRVRFPTRSEEFNQGVEVGVVAAMMTAGTPSFCRWLSRNATSQVEELARRLGYRITEQQRKGDRAEIAFHATFVRPALRVVR